MPVLVIAVTAGLTVVAIEVLPRTLLFPVVDLFAPTGVQSTFLQPGQTTPADCERMLSETARDLRATCSACKVVERCVHGLPAMLRRAVSHEPISQPSARAVNEPLTVVFSAADPSLALSACQRAGAMSAPPPAPSHRVCFAAGMPR